MPFQDDIMREFGRGVAEIEGERTRKKRKPLVIKDRESLADIFDVGIKEIEQSRIKGKPTFVSRVEGALKTLPLTVDPLALVRKEKNEEEVSVTPEVFKAPGIPETVQTPTARRPPEVHLREIGSLEAAKKGIVRGTIGLAESVGTGLEYAGVRTGVNLLKKVGKETRKYWKEKAEPLEAPPEIQGSILNDPGIMLKGNWWAYNLANMVPSFASMMIPGVAAGKYLKIAGKVLELTPKVIERLVKFGSMTAAGVVGGGMEGTSTYQEILKRGGSEQDAAAGMEAMTLAAGALNSIGFGKITGKLGTQKSNAIINFLKNGSWEGLTEYLEEPVEVLIKMGLLPESAFTKKEAIEQLKAGINVIPIAGVMGGGTSMIFAEPSDTTKKLKKTVLDGITKTYEEGTQNADQAIGLVIRGYKNQLFDDTDLGNLSKKYPELRDGIETAKEEIRIEAVKDTLTDAIESGLETGVLEGHVFRNSDAINFIRQGVAGDILTSEDIESFKEKYPELRGELNNLIAEKVTTDIALEFDKFEFEPIIEPVIEEPKVDYAIQDIENIYLKAKERVKVEPVSLQEIQERFKERQGREASTKEQEELKRIYEKAKRRSQKRKIFEERRKEKEAPPKTKEELELEAYEPSLPPGAKEVRVREGERTYPRGAEYIAGKPAPEELKVEYKPVLKKVGKKDTPWLTLSGARDAIESDKMKAGDISPATHKVVETKGGYCIVPIKAKGEPLAREVKEEVKGKTLLSWVRAKGGVKDKTLPGEIRALSVKEAGIVGLTTTEAEKGLGFDEMAAAAVEEGWIAKPEDFSETLRDDIFAQKEGKLRPVRLTDIAARTEREERWKEFDRAETDMLEYFAEHKDEEIVTDLDEWQREAITDIRTRDAKRAKEIEESTRREVEKENKDLEGLKGDEGFSEFIESWDEREALDEETLTELEAWRSEKKEEPTEPEVPEVKPEVPEPKDPISTLLSSKKKAGIKYEMEVTIAETGDTVSVTKDAAVALRETKEELNKYEKFLECLI